MWGSDASVSSHPSGCRRVEALEELHALGEDLGVVGRGGEERADGHVDAPRFLARVLAVAQVGLVHDLGEAGEAAIAQPRSLQERLEGTVLALVAELHAGRVERDRGRREFRWRRENELRLGIDEPPDEPGRRDPIDVRPRPGDPPATPQCGQIQASGEGRVGLIPDVGYAWRWPPRVAEPRRRPGRRRSRGPGSAGGPWPAAPAPRGRGGSSPRPCAPARGAPSGSVRRGACSPGRGGREGERSTSPALKFSICWTRTSVASPPSRWIS